MPMKKILLSVSMLAVVATLGIGATNAIFSDDEASTGNTFTAGAVDLTVDNESYYNGQLNEGTSWLQAANLDDGNGPADGQYLFFNFDDVKPGDWGEDTISLHVNNNDSWLCVDVTLTSNDDNGLTEPESYDGDTTDGVGEGELADAIDFKWWADDGDNVYEDDETLLPAGPLGNLAVGETAVVALADSNVNIWGDEGPLPGDSVRYIGKAWCLGDMAADPVPQDGEGKTGDNGPLDRGTGFTCDGSGVNNVTQTDSISADIVFYAEQSRHNGEFVCGGEPQRPTTITVRKTIVNDNQGTATTSDFSFFVGETEVVEGVATAVATGTYQVSEQGPNGYLATFGGDCDASGEVTVTAGQQAVCTITNDDVADPLLTVDKVVSYSTAGLSVDPGNFPFTLKNNETDVEYTFNDEVQGTLPAGTYTITETYIGVQNISFHATFIGDCSEIGTTDTGTITVEDGNTYSCQVLNNITASDTFHSQPNGQQGV